MAKISLQNIRKVYPGGVEVVPKLNLEIADKDLSCWSALPAAVNRLRCV